MRLRYIADNVLTLLRTYSDRRELQMAEIGVAGGGISCELLNVVKNLVCFMIDPYVPWGRAGHDLMRENLLRAFEASAPNRPRAKMMVMTSEEASKLLPDASLDLVFIDADHRYENVRHDIALWAPKLKPNAFLCGHDYDLASGNGVERAVDEFAEDNGCQIRLMPRRIWWTVKPEVEKWS